MTGLSLPALDGRSPLGFLAGLGVLRLVSDDGYTRARLSWSPQDCSAVLHDAQPHLDGLAGDLLAIATAIPDGGVLPGMPTDFPPPGAAPDKLRLPRKSLREYAKTLYREGGAAAERWLSSLVTDLTLDDRGRADISLFAAPSGKQSMRTMLEKPLEMVRRHPGSMTEALQAWRRYSGVTGEYLDHRVLFDAADAPDGKSLERGVPGATWLALMAYPLFLTTASGRPLSSGWQPPQGRSRVTRFVYPLWSRPVDVDGAIALLTHPVLRQAAPGTPPAAARAASIFLVGAAERRRLPGRTFAGVLTPVRNEPPTAAVRSRSRDAGPRQPAARSAAIL